MKILALDLGKFNSACCVFDTKTRKAEFCGIATQQAAVRSVFKSTKPDLVVMEACGPSGWIHNLAQELKLKTLVCSTNEEAWKWANVKRKTDKDDALKLACIAATQVNKTKNAIRAWFVNQGITIDKGEKAWHTGRELINSYRKPLAECEPNE